jgi:hypothetical protein
MRNEPQGKYLDEHPIGDEREYDRKITYLLQNRINRAPSSEKKISAP